ncbi:MAG: hypothetical protein IBJ05_09295, partial [Blastomonas sp.]|nr:hypothetical protein [Blastomonas sp.]
NSQKSGKTGGGLRAARSGDLAMMAIPCSDGQGFWIVTAAPGMRPIRQWCRDDGFGFGERVADEAGFRAHAEACAGHLRQRDALARVQVSLCASTPWGSSQSATRYAQGILFYTTASHGGFHLDPERNAAMPPALCLPGGWYEEDVDWALIAAGYPELFTDLEKRMAERILRQWRPEAWLAVHGSPAGADPQPG